MWNGVVGKDRKEVKTRLDLGSGERDKETMNTERWECEQSG